MIQRWRANFALLLVSVVLLVGALLGLMPLLSRWQVAVHTPSAAGASAEQLASLRYDGDLVRLLNVVNAACPTGRPLLLLNDNPDLGSAMQVDGNYLLYPRHVELIGAQAPVTAEQLSKGACLLSATAATDQRLAPYRDNFTSLACNSFGCVYRVD